MNRLKHLVLGAALAVAGLVGHAHGAGLVETFNVNPTLSPTAGPGLWYTDRYAPAGFVSTMFDGDRRLLHSIDASACEPCRGGGFTSAFYNTQGRSFDLPPATTSMSIQMYVPSDWASTGRRMAGFWGVGRDAGNAVSSYPIVEFTSTADGSGQPRFRGWDGVGAWVDMGLPTGFAYDRWYTLSVSLVGSDWVYKVGNLSLTIPAGPSVRIGNTILQGHNNVAGVTYDIYWDNLFTNATAGLALTTSSCSTDNTVTVSIDMSGASQAVAGGQFFLQYDQTRLDFVSATPAGGPSPFSLEIFESVNESTGTIDYAVGAPFGNPGTSADSAMAILTFNWIGGNQCSTGANLVQFRDHNPITRLTNALSEPISPTLTPLPSISVDNTPPIIACPADITVNADAGLCTASPSSLLGAGWSYFGSGSSVALGGNMVGRLPSIGSMTPPYAGLAHTPSSPYTMASVASIGMDYMMTQGCLSGGSPRFVFSVDTDNNGVSNGTIICHVANPPSFNDCPTLNQWISTGNLISLSDARWEIGGSLGGGPYRTHAQMLADFAGAEVLVAYIVTDSAWNGDDDMYVDNVNINGAVQSFNNATASDNCGSVTVSATRSDSLTLMDPYPTGTTTVTWTATDACGNSTSCNQFVTVNPYNTVNATVRLESVSASPAFTRCITFGLDDCGTYFDVPITFTNGIGTASFDVPCGAGACFTARDKKHTLRRTKLATISGPNYSLSFTGADQLLGGNVNDDNVIDILDFGGFTGQYAANLGANTACGYSGLHADFSGNGLVDTADFTYIQIHFLEFSALDCCGNPREEPILSISVADLVAGGMAEYAAGDVNRDGMLDTRDIDVFIAHGGFPNCTPDFDGDGDIGTDADIEAFFACLAGNCCHLCASADFDGDGDLGTDADIEAFFRVLAGGPC
jgi:hypothetical protein